ncbi:MAG: hypothetical protein JSU59_06430 [Nitrospirota bacterium]|nr:MAG: hypothetical protein JSU59_06430 [Nitrospirota bacterium]
MGNLNSVQKLSQFSQNPGKPGKNMRSSISSIFLMGGVFFLLTLSWLGGCSSSPKSTSDPTKEEVQTDSDRFFKNLEKEETKKEAKDAKP